jgi:hypothetical protein
MHYRNGREAKNGDCVVSLGNGGGSQIEAVGVLQNATPGNDYCNGEILIRPYRGQHGAALITGACLCDCLHADDLGAILAEKGLDKRPVGK